MDEVNNTFELAINAINNLTTRPSNDELLKMYAFYKQAKEGNVQFERPSILNMKNRAKWDAWNKLKNMDKKDAMLNYIALAYKLTNNEQFKMQL
jgi:diazepam-binding inhibitor (GABA receptor modulating acyl-CoA-binding protein)